MLDAAGESRIECRLPLGPRALQPQTHKAPTRIHRPIVGRVAVDQWESHVGGGHRILVVSVDVPHVEHHRSRAASTQQIEHRVHVARFVDTVAQPVVIVQRLAAGGVHRPLHALGVVVEPQPILKLIQTDQMLPRHVAESVEPNNTLTVVLAAPPVGVVEFGDRSAHKLRTPLEESPRLADACGLHAAEHCRQPARAHARIEASGGRVRTHVVAAEPTRSHAQRPRGAVILGEFSIVGALGEQVAKWLARIVFGERGGKGCGIGKDGEGVSGHASSIARIRGVSIAKRSEC